MKYILILTHHSRIAVPDTYPNKESCVVAGELFKVSNDSNFDNNGFVCLVKYSESK